MTGHQNLFTVLYCIATQVEGSCGRMVFTTICLFFPDDISKNDAAGITKLDTQMFHNNSWKTVYFVGQKVKDQGHKTLPAWVIALLRLLVSSSYDCTFV